MRAMETGMTALGMTRTAARRTAATLGCLSVLMLAGCRQDMQNQPKFYPQRGTDFYADGRSVRPQVTNTVARGQEDVGSYFRTGMMNGAEGDGLPMPLTPELIARGQQNYNVYCTACHSRVGNGRGMIVMRGYHAAGNFHTERLRNAPMGHFYSVIANGYGAMPDYAGQIIPEDRWAIVAYIRALQLSQHATTADAGGAPIEKLETVAEHEGLPAHFLDEWVLPPTAGETKYTMPSASMSPAPMPAAAAAVTMSNTAATPLGTPLGTTKGTAKADSRATAPTAVPATKAAAGKTAAIAAAEASASAPSKSAPHASLVDLVAGQRTYMANCSPCHQANHEGMPPMIPSLVGIVGRVGAAHIHSVVTAGIPTGKPAMPAFPQLSSVDVDHVIEFLSASK